MERRTKLKIIKAIDIIVSSFWNSISLSIILQIFLHSINIKIENIFLFLGSCWLMMIFAETMCFRFKTILNDTFYNDIEDKQ